MAGFRGEGDRTAGRAPRLCPATLPLSENHPGEIKEKSPTSARTNVVNVYRFIRCTRKTHHGDTGTQRLHRGDSSSAAGRQWFFQADALDIFPVPWVFVTRIRNQERKLGGQVAGLYFDLGIPNFGERSDLSRD